MTAFRIAVAGCVTILAAMLAAGCACTCPHRGYGTSISPPPSASATGASSSARVPANRTESYYDRYREERHRREVEKELRDIKRNTQKTRREIGN